MDHAEQAEQAEPVEPEELVVEPEAEERKATVKVKAKRAPRKAKAPPQDSPPEAPLESLPASFWTDLVQTRREMEVEARATRFANLVKF
jgi:hypothetical protein